MKATDTLSAKDIKAAVKALEKNKATTVWGFTWEFPFFTRFYEFKVPRTRIKYKKSK